MMRGAAVCCLLLPTMRRGAWLDLCAAMLRFCTRVVSAPGRLHKSRGAWLKRSGAGCALGRFMQHAPLSSLESW